MLCLTGKFLKDHFRLVIPAPAGGRCADLCGGKAGMTVMACKLSAVIITLNEEKNIGECLEGLRFCDEIVLMDSGSADRTVEIAKGLGARVYSHAFQDYASQKNYGIDKASGEWILSVDADERVNSELKEEIRQVLREPKADGYLLPRRNRIFGRWMHHGINRADFQLRLARKEAAVFDGQVHERIHMKGKPGRLKHPLLHYSTQTISQYMRKLNGYTDLEVRRMHERGLQAEEGKWRTRPLGLFLYQIFWKQAWRDDLEGLLFTVLSAYYEFVRQAKLWERLRHKLEVSNDG